jgi:hypothetical protein
MSRGSYIGLEQSKTRVLDLRRRDAAEQRAALEEELCIAYAVGDMRRVAELRAAIAELDGEVSG